MNKGQLFIVLKVYILIQTSVGRNFDESRVDPQKLVSFNTFQVNPVIKECNREHNEGDWQATGTFNVASFPYFEKNYKTIVTIELSSSAKPKIWRFDIRKCIPPIGGLIFGSYCRKKDQLVTLFIRELPNIYQSGGILTVFVRPKISDTHPVFKHKIGTLPKIYDNIQVTYELKGHVEQSPLLGNTTVTVSAAVPENVTLVFCARNIFPPLIMSFNGEVLDSKGGCISKNFLMKTETIKLSYRELDCLRRAKTFHLNIEYNSTIWVYLVISLFVGVFCALLISFVVIKYGLGRKRSKRRRRSSRRSSKGGTTIQNSGTSEQLTSVITENTGGTSYTTDETASEDKKRSNRSEGESTSASSKIPAISKS